MGNTFLGEIPNNINTLNLERYSKTDDGQVGSNVIIKNALVNTTIGIKGSYDQNNAGGLIIPGGSSNAIGTINSGPIWYTVDNSSPLVGKGHLVQEGQTIILETLEEINNFDCIPDTGVTVGIYWTFNG